MKNANTLKLAQGIQSERKKIMADVKWIKMATEIFDNRKIRQIESLPDGDAIIVIWMKLLCLAGNINDNGLVYFTKEIPYTDQMLSTQFNRPMTTVQLAISTFEQFGMVEVIDNLLHISNWEKYQNVEGMEKIREQTRKRVAKHRENQKLLDCNVTVTQCNATDKNKIREDKKRIEEDKNNKNICDSDEPQPAPIKKSKPVKHRYGEYDNVLLTDEELEKLKAEYHDIDERIERLSSYVASTGKVYKSHYATIRNWAKKDKDKPQKAASNNRWNNGVNQRQYDFETMERIMASQNQPKQNVNDDP